MKKMNNKGFSLVELIVVVLIMAIIAVALAPQVMKWVENSRKSNDIENYNALIEAANVAGTDEKVIKAIGGSSGTGSATVRFSTTGTTISSTALEAAMIKTLPTATATKVESAWAGAQTGHVPPFTFTVSVTADGIKVTRTCDPMKDFS